MASKRPLLVVGVVCLLAATSLVGHASAGAGATPADATTVGGPSAAVQDQQTPENNTTRASEEEIERRALSNESPVESVTGNVAISTEIDDETRTMRAQVWQEPPDNARFEFVSGPAEGTVIVSNGTTIWFYNATTDTVRRFEYGTEFTRSLTRAFQNFSQQYTAEYLGPATVSGQETYAVSIQVPEGPLDEVLRNQTVWLDQETWFPVQTRVTTSVGNRTSTTTLTYSNVTYNASIPADRFTFEPPENATVVDVALPRTETFDSVEAASNAVNFSIRQPQSLPNGYELANVTVTSDGNATSVLLQYGNETGTLMFSQSTADRSPAPGGNVSVAGNPALYREVGNQGTLQWQSDGFAYTVSGPFSRATLIEIAESVYN